MSFISPPFLNLNVCEISVLQTVTGQNIQFGSILKDTGASISLINTETILLPANKNFLIKTNIICNKDLSTAGMALLMQIQDTSARALQYQASAYLGVSEGVYGGSSGATCLTIDLMCLLFEQNQDLQIQISFASLTAGQTATIEYNSINTYTPNSSITILYT